MSLIIDHTFQLLAAGVDARFERQQLLASNVANIDTPGYQPQDLDFEGALQAEMGAAQGAWPPGMARSDDAHLPAGAGVAATPDRGEVIERPDVTNTLDGNGVDLDKEMARLTDNALRYNATVEMMRRRMGIVNLVISQLGGP